MIEEAVRITNEAVLKHIIHGQARLIVLLKNHQ